MNDPMKSIKEAAGIVPPNPTKRQKNREDMKGLLTYHSPAVIKQLKIIGAEQDKNHQQLAIEALNLLFTKYGKKTIA